MSADSAIDLLVAAQRLGAYSHSKIRDMDTFLSGGEIVDDYQNPILIPLTYSSRMTCNSFLAALT
jgi:hypothetical protein